MSDLGADYAEKRIRELERALDRLYSDAQKEIEKKTDDFFRRSAAREKQKLAQVKSGKMTQEAFDKWKSGQVFIGKQWTEKERQMADTLAKYNQIALDLVDGKKFSVFAFNANYAAYYFEHDAGVGFGFGLYDSATVARMVAEKPNILPFKKLDKKKDERWNWKNIRAQVTQGVVQGESIPQIAKRMQAVTGKNKTQATLYARTAMTSAQNGGRQARYEEAEALGIKFKKVWLATLDGHTRDLHADLDGVAVEPDEDFGYGKYAVEYPGDPYGLPEMVYNCRCTMVTELKDYPNKFNRRITETGEVVEDLTYSEWYAQKALGDNNAKIKDLQDIQKKLQDEINKLDPQNTVFSGIWKYQDVKYSDYEAKKDSIAGKKDYYENKLDTLKAQGLESSAEYLDTQKKLDELAKFEENGKKYAELTAKLRDTNDKIIALRPPDPAQKNSPFSPDAYSQERKDNALWTTDKTYVDSKMRAKTAEVWKNATAEERDAIYEYTQSYSKYNEPLRGIEYYGSFVGVGKTDLNANIAKNGNRLNKMTDILDKTTYDFDMWLQRGVDFSGMEHFFQCDSNLLLYGTEKDLNDKLLGKTVTEYGFMSCGSAKGQGFSGDILLNIYAPKGTKMMYVEPFSKYSGSNVHQNWDGVSGQQWFGSEFETILQQGTEFSVEKIERKGSQIYVDLYVKNQDKQQRWKP